MHDYVIIINADTGAVTGKKRENKLYYCHSLSLIPEDLLKLSAFGKEARESY